MAGRPKSTYRARSDRGREFGVVATPQDRVRLGHLARWYCLSAEHLARYELEDEALWNPYLTGLPTGERTEAYAKRVRSIKERLGKLVRVQDNPGNHTGPFVGSALVDDGLTAWYATRYGITAAHLPWRFRSAINPQFAAHAMMAADVGMQIESLGYTVYSEREIATATAKSGEEIPTRIESTYTTGTGSQVKKRPDLAVVAPDGERFHAIEVEREQNRALGVYAEKLTAYDSNPAMTGVWYLCAYPATARRVARAANKVFANRDFNLRVRVVPALDRWHGIEGLATDDALLSDLRRVDL